MKIVAFMQNQWFDEPDEVRAMLDRQRDCGEFTQEQMREKVRRRLIHYALFAGCLSGRRLKKTFGEMTQSIIWEEASREIGGHAASSFPADMDHIKAVLKEESPDVVLTFGKTATQAIEVVRSLTTPTWEFIPCCHPAARHVTVEVDLLRAAEKLHKYIDSHEPVR